MHMVVVVVVIVLRMCLAVGTSAIVIVTLLLPLPPTHRPSLALICHFTAISHWSLVSPLFSSSDQAIAIGAHVRGFLKDRNARVLRRRILQNEL